MPDVTLVDNSTRDVSNSVQDRSASVDVRSLNQYEWMNSTYLGDKGYRDGTYLIAHPREAFYNDRRRSSFYKNYFKAIIDAMIVPVFSSEIKRTVDDDVVETFIEDADNCGTALNDIVKQAVTVSRVCGSAFVVMDTNQSDGLPQTVAEAVDSRAIPYIYVKKPYEIKEYENDRGRLTSITFYDKVVKSGTDTVQQYRRWDREFWYLLEDAKDRTGAGNNYIVVESGRHGLGEIPVIPVLNFVQTKSLAAIPDPPLVDMASVCYSIYNRESDIRNLERVQAFSILCLQGVGDDIVIGPSNFISVPLDAKIAPMFVSPDSAHLVNLVANCAAARQDMYMIAEQNGVTGVKLESGVSKEWDFRAHESVLKQTAAAAVELEEKICDLLGAYMGTEYDTDPQYPKQYSPSYSSERTKFALDAVDRVPPAPVQKAFWEEIIKEYWHGDDDRIEIITEALNMEEEKPEEPPVAPVVPEDEEEDMPDDSDMPNEMMDDKNA